MRILGIDPGTGILGFGVIDVVKGKAKLVDAGVIRTPAHEDDVVRLQTTYDELSDIITQTKPTHMAVEKLFFGRNVTTAISVGQARGSILLAAALAGLDVIEYTPAEIKQAISGYGNADKEQVQEMVRQLLGLEEAPQPDDAADGVAIAICHLQAARYRRWESGHS